jgi:oligopeptide/dipeptide ABC transporter ATP-binding protein
MYAGQIIEEADVNTIFEQPFHPYTKGLIASVPVLGNTKDELDTIPGNVPNLINLPVGCRFASRCSARENYNLEICNDRDPELINVKKNHSVRCWLYQDSDNYKAPIKL